MVNYYHFISKTYLLSFIVRHIISSSRYPIYLHHFLDLSLIIIRKDLDHHHYLSYLMNLIIINLLLFSFISFYPIILMILNHFYLMILFTIVNFLRLGFIILYFKILNIHFRIFLLACILSDQISNLFYACLILLTISTTFFGVCFLGSFIISFLCQQLDNLGIFLQELGF